MKKSFMTRALAMGLSLAMAFSLSAATNVTTAAAAAKPAMKSTKMTVKVGQSKNYAATAATQKAYKITKIKMSAAGKTKADVTINSSKKSIKVTGKAATKGSNVVITFKNNKTKKTSKVTTKVVVKATAPEVKQAITSVTQKSFTTLEVKFQEALEKIDGTFSITRVNDNQDIQIKSSALDTTDKTKVTLTTYISLTDGKEYVVKYTANDEAKTVYEGKVTVSDGTVADVAITPLEVTVNVATELKYQTLDKNGLVISEKNIKKTASEIDVDWTSNLGTVDDATGNLTLYNVGDTATFTVTYHTYKYDQTTGAETGVIKKDFTVTCVKDATTVSQYVYTAATEKPYLWSKVDPKNTIALSDNDADTAQRTAWFLIKDSKGNNITDTCGYTVESSDNSIVVADGTVKDGAPLVPVAKGTAYIMIKDADGKVVNTMPITVGDKRKITTLKLSTNSVSVASTASITQPEECAYVDVIAKDQYGEDIGGAATWEMKTDNEVTDMAALATDGKSLRIAGDQNHATGKKGSDVYKISVTDYAGNAMTTTLTANSIQVSGSESVSLVFLDTANDNKVVTSVDTTVSESSAYKSKHKNLQTIVVTKQNGVVTGVDDNAAHQIASVKVTKNDGTVIAYTNTGSSFKVANIVTSAAINKDVIATVKTGTAMDDAYNAMNISVTTAATINASGEPTAMIEKNLGVGTYTVRYVISGAKNDAVGSFSVVDSNTAVTAKVKETNTDSVENLKDFFSNKDNVEFYYGDVNIESAVDRIAIDYSINSNGKNAYVKSVTIEVTSANNSQTYKVKVPVNKTFTTSGTYTKAGIWV